VTIGEMELKDRQLAGLKLTILLALLVYAAISASFWKQETWREIPYSGARDGSLVVELAGDITQAGVYYLPEKTTLSRFMSMAGVNREAREEANLSLPLTSGASVRIGEDGKLTVGKMRGALRLALSLPIDINTATREELLMVPGIGEKTAGQIMALRASAKGGIRSLDELMKIKGIKEKRLEKMRGYLYAGAG